VPVIPTGESGRYRDAVALGDGMDFAAVA